MRKITLVHNYYNYSPEKIWAVANNWEALAEMSEPLVRFYNLPKGKFVANSKSIFEVSSVFGKGKNNWQVEFLEIDDEKMFFKSREFGDNVEVWNHELKILANNNGAQLIEEIEIETQKGEFLLYILTKLLYIRRHFGRLKILKQNRAKNG